MPILPSLFLQVGHIRMYVSLCVRAYVRACVRVYLCVCFWYLFVLLWYTLETTPINYVFVMTIVNTTHTLLINHVHGTTENAIPD